MSTSVHPKKSLRRLVFYLMSLLLLAMLASCAQVRGDKPIPPTVKIVAPANGAVLSGPVTVQGKASNNESISKVTYTMDGGAEQDVAITPGKEVSFSFELTNLLGGSHIVSVTAFNAENNQSKAARVNFTIKGSGGADDVTIANFFAKPPSGAAPLATSLSWVIANPDGENITCILDYGDGKSKTISNCTTSSETHTYTDGGIFVANLTIKAGDTVLTKRNAVVSVNDPNNPSDNANPVISAFSANPATGDAPLAVDFSWAIDDVDGDALKCTVVYGDGESNTIASCKSSSSASHSYASPGVYTATLVVEDGEGGAALTTTEITVKDSGNPPPANHDPVIGDFAANPNPVNAGDPTTFGWTISDADGDTLKCTLFYGDGESKTIDSCDSSSSASHSYVLGDYNATLVVSDGKGGSNNKTIVVVASDLSHPNEAPVISSFSADPMSGDEPLAVAFSAKFSDPDAGDTLTCTLDYGDNTSDSVPDCGSPLTLDHEYASVGVYIAKLTVTDNGTPVLSDSNTVTITVNSTSGGNDDPSVSLTASPRTSTTGSLTTTFSIEATDPNGDPLVCTLDFGDGSPVKTFDPCSTNTVEHTYNASATATLTAEDNKGGKAEKQISLDVTNTPITEPTAVIRAGPRVASLNTADSELLNKTLSGLLGEDITLSVADYNDLLTTSIPLSDLLDGLGSLGTGLGPEGLGGLDLSNLGETNLEDLFNTLADLLSDNTDLEQILRNLADAVTGLTGTINPGNLLVIDPNATLVSSTLNLGDLIVGAIQLYNYDNVASTPEPVVISGTELGLGDVMNQVTLQLQVVEPPVITFATEGSTFHSSAIRLKLDLDLVDIAVNQDDPAAEGLVSGLLDSVADLLEGLGVATLNLNLSVGQLSLYGEIGSVDGVVNQIDMLDDAIKAVKVGVTPGVVNLYLGNVPDDVFFNRSSTAQDISDNLDFGTIGSLDLHLKINALGLGGVLGDLLGSADIQLGILAKGSALGAAPREDTLIFNSFPSTLTTDSSADAVSVLLDNLLGNLNLDVKVTSKSSSGVLGDLLGGLVDDVVGALLGNDTQEGLLGGLLLGDTGLLSNLLAPLNSLLGPVLDPVLDQLGISIGEADVSVVETLLPTQP